MAVAVKLMLTLPAPVSVAGLKAAVTPDGRVPLKVNVTGVL